MNDLSRVPRTPRVIPPPEHMIDGPEMPVLPPPALDAADRPAPVSGEAIIDALPKADRGKVDPADLARIAARPSVPAANNKLKRMADALGTTPEALRAAASDEVKA